MDSLEEVLRFPPHAHSDRWTIIPDMKTTTTLIAAGAAFLGLGGAAAAYQLAAADEPTLAPVSQQVSEEDATPVAPTIKPRTHFEWAPCKAPAVLDHGACVTEVVQTVVLPGPASTGSSSSGSGGSSDSTSGTHHSSAGGSGDEAGEEETEPGDDHGDDDGEDHGDDHGDDDGGGEDEPDDD